MAKSENKTEKIKEEKSVDGKNEKDAYEVENAESKKEEGKHKEETTPDNEDDKEEGAEKKPKKIKGKESKSRNGIAHIYTSFNNTILHITDMAGSSITRVSGGMMTKHDRLKANPTVAMFIAKKAAEVAKDAGITNLSVRVKAKTGNPAPGPGAHAIVRSLSREGIRIISIADTTKIPRGGPKKKGGKRGRRV